MRQTNSAGVWGFIFACLAVCFGWMPYVGGIFWLLGAILSCVGLGSYPRVLAWIGFIISFFWIAVWLFVGFIAGSFAAFTLYPYYLW